MENDAENEMETNVESWELLRRLFKPHPWHGIPIGESAPEEVAAYIEIVPSDTVKYEVEKASGYLRVDRPQRFSNVCPSLYGFIPRTYCGERTADLCRKRTGRRDVVGDGDPLDVCVLTERNFTHGDFLLRAMPVGGLRLIDEGEADDKIIAVLAGDTMFSGLRELDELPDPHLERLKHYFLTYKEPPRPGSTHVELDGVYGRTEAHRVIEASQADYGELFPDLGGRLDRLLGIGKDGGGGAGGGSGGED